CCSFFFFFQAEDGIRDFHVTGVQTCALPILATTSSRGRRPARLSRCRRSSPSSSSMTRYGRPSSLVPASKIWTICALLTALAARSEERRVGKEGTSGWTAEQWINKTGEERGK